MKHFFLLICLLVIANTIYPNSAMPGVWGPGANGQFTPLFAEDSIYLGKIQMQREQILVNIYPGFAVVKGEYWMYNTTSQPIYMHVAYPKQGQYYEPHVYAVIPSYISGLEVRVNDQPTPLMQSSDSAIVRLGKQKHFLVEADNYEKWFLWKIQFAPKTLTKITVYFLTNNSHAQVSRGYKHRSGDAFSYVLESGRAWGGPIDTGSICIQLKGGLSEDDISGVLPDNVVYGNADKILYSFAGKEPLPQDNLLLFYKDNPEDFDFERTVLPKAEIYFRETDAFDTAGFEQGNMHPLHKLDIQPTGLDFMDWLVIGFFVFVALVVGLVIWLLIKIYKRVKRSKQTD